MTLGAFAAIAVLALLICAAIWSGIGDERLRIQAQSAVASLVGEDFDARIGATSISLGDLGRPTLEVSDARLVSADEGREAMAVGYMRFGLRIFPLVRGETKLGNVEIGDARIELAAMPRTDGGIGLAIFDEGGLVNPDAVIAALFEGAQRIIGSAGRSDVDHISLKNVEIALRAGADANPLHIRQAVFRGSPSGELSVTATIEVGGRIATIDGEAARDARTGLIRTLSVRLDASGENEMAVEPEAVDDDRAFLSASLTITGTQRAEGDVFDISGRIAGLDVKLGDNDRIVGDIELKAAAVQGTGKLEINALRVATGRSAWNFHGAIGPTPASAAPDGKHSYRFELVSDGSVIAPAGSPEPALEAVARIAGHLNPDASLLTLEDIRVRSRQGELHGNAAIARVEGKTPGIKLRLSIDDMPVSQVKQVWPWFAAPGARNWVLANIYGGLVGEGSLELDVPPGRMGNGIPFGADEIFGAFAISGTRFDVAGRIPPVRDSNGSVEFRGTDIDVALQSGTVFMPGGRTVAASGGTLTIRDVHKQPVIGKLNINVAGDADAVLQLASYDPINVDRFIDIQPDEIEGKVSGLVIADIPLQRNISAENLAWRVELSYTDLDLAKPFEGQVVSDAVGTIKVDPRSAVIDAKARLNGAPATLSLVEPLGQSTVARARRVALQLDDKARNAIAPGLNTLLSGTAEVELDDASKDRRLITASLDRATLTIPWVGWSKGNGVGADVAFAMKTDGNRIDLTDFKLSGDTFGATGALALVGGNVVSARFPSASLNRGDDFSFDMVAKGKGYAITIRGQSIDARSIVKLYAADAKGGTAAGGEPVPVSIDMEVASLVGFHGATFRNVKLNYSGTGARTDVLEFNATTPEGRPVTFRDGRDGDTRRVEMRSGDAGTLLRFLDVYENMEGGDITLALAGRGDGPLSGRVDARDFWLVNEPRLSSIVSTAPAQSGRSLNQAVRGEIDTSRVQFEQGYSRIEKGVGYLSLDSGVLRGPLVGATYQGMLYDRAGNMAMTGTFMPAYGLNRIFGEIPLIGQILGNGRDRGLIGITFRVAGSTQNPQLEVNPLSVIAPGIFRSVFEYR
jgi:hypothetical protein